LAVSLRFGFEHPVNAMIKTKLQNIRVHRI
jgi:hypothetical protein